jgi:hypothetical protein
MASTPQIITSDMPRQLSDQGPDGCLWGASATDLVGAYGSATPVARRASGSQAAVITTGATSTAPFGFVTAAQADSVVTLVNEIRAALVSLNLIKGAA